jgi:hypothetical protein
LLSAEGSHATKVASHNEIDNGTFLRAIGALATIRRGSQMPNADSDGGAAAALDRLRTGRSSRPDRLEAVVSRFEPGLGDGAEFS